MNLGQATNVYLDTFKQGGGSYLPNGKRRDFQRGYLVGGVVPSRVLNKSVTRWPSEYVDAIQEFAREHRALLAQPGYYLGTWVNNGDLHLDVSQIVLNRVDAIGLGLSRQELAIWDVENGSEVELQRFREAVVREWNHPHQP